MEVESRISPIGKSHIDFGCRKGRTKRQVANRKSENNKLKSQMNSNFSIYKTSMPRRALRARLSMPPITEDDIEMVINRLG
jgi:hypothetical protein